MPVLGRFCAFFTAVGKMRNFPIADDGRVISDQSRYRGSGREFVFAICTDFRHQPVDGLHSAENTKVTKCDFPLTKKTEVGNNILVL